ncbi:MAG: VWA domain-containing protein [Akkermansiaceae bacterium]|nr:VWA domain-containing protein [Akkermansiaceae bacterium]
MKTTILLAIAAFAALAPADAKGRKHRPEVDPSPAKNKVQVALLLDTSNSMDGLIDQAKTQLWKVVNTFIDARRDGEAPFVEVALFEYGNNNQPVGNHYIRQVHPLTRDLDEISKQLFALTTNGGEEYCGAVIQRALTDLTWDDNKRTYKAIFIAGNEPFTQGPVSPMQVCRDGFSKGILINTIHCGSRSEGVNGSWNDGADLGGGKFMIIDQDRAVCHIDAPQDARIRDLGVELNKTYLGYGAHWREGAAKQAAADKDAAANEAAGAATQRSVSKASANYHNSSWDLVDAVKENKVELSKLKPAELPKELQNLGEAELKQRIEDAAKKRADLQKEIQTLNKQREEFVAAEMKKQAEDGAQTLDQALVETTRSQAEKLGYKFGE